MITTVVAPTKVLTDVMVADGCKATLAGVIPGDWEVRPLLKAMTVAVGQVDPKREPFRSMVLVAPDHVESGTGRLLQRCSASEQHAISGKYLFRSGDIVYSKIRPYLRKAILADFEGLCSADMYPLTPAPDVVSAFIFAVLLGQRFSSFAESVSVRSGIPKINREELSQFMVALPPAEEQRAIAAALSDAEELISALDKVISKKRSIKLATMQQLLTGKKRLPGYTGTWEMKTIGEIASLSSQKNGTAEILPVLTCSKHSGFVDSLGYFKNQIFSKDTSTYKIIRRGQIGYPANHVEEGSIGVQDLYDVALVSPIYIVFSVSEEVDSFFLHRVLKKESYRQKFETATTSSVDRRGSLRWPAFSEITVSIPPLAEQMAIVTVLRDLEAEIAALKLRRDKTKAIKQGMMQALLTGRTRLVNPGAEK